MVFLLSLQTSIGANEFLWIEGYTPVSTPIQKQQCFCAEGGRCICGENCQCVRSNTTFEQQLEKVKQTAKPGEVLYLYVVDGVRDESLIRTYRKNGYVLVVPLGYTSTCGTYNTKGFFAYSITHDKKFKFIPPPSTTIVPTYRTPTTYNFSVPNYSTANNWGFSNSFSGGACST